MTMTHRLMPPSSGSTTISANGRTWTCAVGSTIDVPDQDMAVMTANGWLSAAPGGCGATASRPATPAKGLMFHDTTLGYNVIHDGKTWRNPTSGASV